MFKTWYDSIMHTINTAKGEMRKPSLLRLNAEGSAEIENLFEQATGKPVRAQDRHGLVFMGIPVDSCGRQPNLLCEDGAIYAIPRPGDAAP